MGATYHGVKIGARAHADITALSFHPVKLITTAEGGTLLTNDAMMGDHPRRLRSHGTERASEQVTDWEGPWHVDRVELGYNYRLTDFQCALGASQMARLDHFVAARRGIAALYDEFLAGSALFQRPVTADWACHTYHVYVLRADFGAQGLPDRREFFRRCLERRIRLQVHYRPVPLNSFYLRGQTPDEVAARIPVSMEYYRKTFSVPMFPTLTPDDVAYVVANLQDAARA